MPLLLNKVIKVKKIKTDPKIPKSLKACFLILAVSLGIDVGFIKCLNKEMRFLLKCISFLASILVMLILCFYLLFPVGLEALDKFWMTLVACQCLMNYLILSFTKFTFYDFIVKILRVDASVTESQNERVGYATCFYIFVVSFIKLIISFVIYTSDSAYVDLEATLYFIISTYASLCPDVMSIIFALTYYFIHCYVKKLCLLVKAANTSLKDVQQYYMNIAACSDSIRGLYDNLLVIELSFETIKLLITCYYILTVMQQKVDIVFLLNEGTFCAHSLFRMLMPAIMAEMVYSKVEEIKKELHYQLLLCEDERKKNEILETLRYMGARKLKHKIWRFIPIDLNLPLNIIKLTITYFIVIVQFSHLV